MSHGSHKGAAFTLSTLHSLSSRGTEQPLVRINGHLQSESEASSVPSYDRPKSSSHAMGRGMKEWFGRGVTIGLGLGCLCMILFHQLNGSHAVSSMVNVAKPTIATLHPKASQPSQSGSPVTLPAVRLYAAQSGPYGDLESAKRTVAGAQIKGRTASVFSGEMQGTTNGQHHYVVVYGLASYSAHLTTIAQENAQNHAAIVAFRWNATRVETLSGTRPAVSARVSRWLSAEVSAMSALVAGIMDKEPLVDAETAIRAADRLTPSAEDMKSTGFGTPLENVHHLTDRGLQAVFDKNASNALADVMDAYAALDQIRVHRSP